MITGHAFKTTIVSTKDKTMSHQLMFFNKKLCNSSDEITIRSLLVTFFEFRMKITFPTISKFMSF